MSTIYFKLPVFYVTLLGFMLFIFMSVKVYHDPGNEAVWFIWSVVTAGLVVMCYLTKVTKTIYENIKRDYKDH